MSTEANCESAPDDNCVPLRRVQRQLSACDGNESLEVGGIQKERTRQLRPYRALRRIVGAC